MPCAEGISTVNVFLVPSTLWYTPSSSMYTHTTFLSFKTAGSVLFYIAALEVGDAAVFRYDLQLNLNLSVVFFYLFHDDGDSARGCFSLLLLLPPSGQKTTSAVSVLKIMSALVFSTRALTVSAGSLISAALASAFLSWSHR